MVSAFISYTPFFRQAHQKAIPLRSSRYGVSPRSINSLREFSSNSTQKKLALY
jgi:hypothetical protein